MSGTLYYYDPVDGRWLIVMDYGKLCYDHTCQETDTQRRPPWGDWYVQVCFSAESPGSEWPWQCTGKYYPLP